MVLLDGIATSSKILDTLKLDIQKLSFPPSLDIIIVGDDPASLKYTATKQKKAEDLGINGRLIKLPNQTTTAKLITEINNLNNNPECHAFMVQLPLPKHIDTSKVLSAIDPAKDVDGLNPINLAKLFIKDPSAIAPATPLGIMKLLKDYQINLHGKNAVIIGRSLIVGLPLFALLNNANATTTLCHSHTTDLITICQKADILISAIGKPKYITNIMVKDGAVVIDVGTNYDQAGKLCGDVDFELVAPKCSYITPVPGGVGPMTIAALLYNTYKIITHQYE